MAAVAKAPVGKAPETAPEAAPVAEHEHQDLEPVYVWDRLVRASHWGVALTLVLLAATGIYLGRPFLAAPGPAHEHFLTGWAKVIHFYAAIGFTLCVLARIVWLVIGPRRSSWRNFVPVSKKRRRDLIGTLKFYLLVRPTPPATIGHNPLAGLSYVAVFGMYLLIIATGLALYSVSSYSYMRMWQFLLPVFQGVQGARWLHHVTMWGLLMFFVAHLFFASLTSRNEKNGTMDSIISGYKYLPRGMPADDDDSSVS
ncbi:MAG TPA: Ni/Fe-hydrogenase, b-type cytochrome subunit [Kofleriaceae bacterium]|nr:Ni/Fe-hydrogenase, b-type cytochrome subunit [Kofleriaceae bacterium]